MSSNDWEEVGSATGDTWDIETQPTIIGKYVSRKDNVGVNESTIYAIHEEGKDEATAVWGSAVLDTKFEQINIGRTVKIEYLGRVKGKGPKPYKDFKVSVKPLSEAEQAKAVFPGAEEVAE